MWIHSHRCIHKYSTVISLCPMGPIQNTETVKIANKLIGNKGYLNKSIGTARLLFSRKLADTEVKCTANEKQLLALVYSLK